MKTKLAILLLVGIGAWSVTANAQDANVSTLYSQSAPAGAAATAAPAEIVPLVKFDDTPLRELIEALARDAKLNINFDPSLELTLPDGKPKTVSIRWENVTAENALESVLANHNLQLERNAKTGISRVTKKSDVEPLKSDVIQLYYTSPSNLVSVIKPIIGARSQVIADARTSQLVVLATEKEMEEVKKMIAKLDTATKQVLIEARIIETFRNPQSDKGINWAGTFAAQKFNIGNNPFGTYQPGSGGQPGSYSAGEDSMNAPVTPGGTPGLLGMFSGQNPFGHISPVAYLNADGASAVFSFFNTDNQSEVIATPRAVTADNQAAVLQVSRAVPIFKVTQGGTQVGNSVDITYTNLGTLLEVTPRISAVSNVALKVVPEVSDIEGRDTQVLGGDTYTANIFKVRRITTQVLIPSGNTLVLGGLLGDNVQNIKNKVPILGDLPGMKYIFGSSSKKRSKSNLLIFVTPTIVADTDYQPTSTDFLKQKAPTDRQFDDMGSFNKPWDGVDPYDWGKAVY